MIRLPGLIDTKSNVSGQSLAGKRERLSNTICKLRYQVHIDQKLFKYLLLR